MTDHRRPTIAFTDAPRGTCRWCGEAIVYPSGPKQGELDRRRRWHPACVDEYNMSDPREARRIVRKRDRGICRECRLDTRRLARDVKGRGRTASLRKLGFKPRVSLWELDHVVPLIDGGGHGLDNLQTLCVPCHERKTAREARQRAERRRESNAPSPGSPERISAVALQPEAPGVRRDLDALLAHAEAANQRAEEALARLGRPDSGGSSCSVKPVGGERLA